MSDSLGVWLRRSRETRKVDLEDAVRALRIHRRYLQALEMGDYEALPGPIQARGFLRNYARYLGLPTEEALARYDAEIRGQPLPPMQAMGFRMPEIEVPGRNGLRTWAPPPPSAEEERAAVRANSSSGLMKILLGVIILFVFVAAASFVWLQFGPGDLLSAPSTTQAGITADGVRATATPTAQPTPSFPVAADGTVRLRLVPLSHAWVSVSADADIVFQGVAQPQQAIEAVGEEIVIVNTGNGGAFELFVNGTNWGPLGQQGEIVQRAWTPEGETILQPLPDGGESVSLGDT
jgi:hypothetical protein